MCVSVTGEVSEEEEEVSDKLNLQQATHTKLLMG